MEYHSTTTLAEIRAEEPCKDGWVKLLAHLGKTKADDEPLALLTILESNGLDDALWCLRAKSLDRLSRHFQAWCAEQVLPHFLAERPDDSRVSAQIAMLRNDDATDGERATARDAARDAERDAERDAAGAAAWATAAATAGATAGAAAWAAAWATAWATARDAQERQLRKMIGGEE